MAGCWEVAAERARRLGCVGKHVVAGGVGTRVAAVGVGWGVLDARVSLWRSRSQKAKLIVVDSCLGL